MRTKLLTITATGVVGLVLGAGIGVAAAGQDRPDQPTATMDEMHATMHDTMPAELADECDAMHAAMPEAMRQLDHGAMAPMMGGTGAPHAQHHDNG